jgi:hypothetical protein
MRSHSATLVTLIWNICTIARSWWERDCGWPDGDSVTDRDCSTHGNGTSSSPNRAREGVVRNLSNRAQHSNEGKHLEWIFEAIDPVFQIHREEYGRTERKAQLAKRG